MSNSSWPHGLQHRRLPCSSLSLGVCSSSCPLGQWCYLTISSSVMLFFFCLQSFPVSGSFPVSWLFTASVLSIGPSASASVKGLMNEYSGLIYFDWFDLLVIQGTSRVFSSTTVQKHQFLGSQPSLWSNSHICTCLLEKP